MDPRADPIDYWSLKRGEALVYRNPGGRIANDAKTLWFLDSLMAPIRHLYIVHHTDCGASHSKVDRIAAFTMQHNPTVTEEDLKGIDFGTFTDLEQSVRDDLRFLHESPMVRRGLAEVAKGFVFDLETGLVTEVKV
jgi:carbonic anhydrase